MLRKGESRRGPNHRTDRLEQVQPEGSFIMLVYVRTEDFRMAYHLLRVLQGIGITPVLVDHDHSLPDRDAWWFGTPEEVKQHGGRGVGVDVDTVDEAVSRWLRVVNKLDNIEEFLIGIDPGPRPGCAWFGDEKLLGKSVHESIEATVHALIGQIESYAPQRVLVRIGHGSPLHRDQLVNAFLLRGYPVQQVNEYRTSQGTARNAHANSALKIARMPGQPVVEWREVEPSEGEVRNIQRISRRRSRGSLTISAHLARRVSQGEMTLDEALAKAGYSSSGTSTG